MSDHFGEHRSVLTEEQLAPPLPGEGRLAVTRWLILLELHWQTCWRFYCVLGLFLSCAWFDLFSLLPGLLHLFVLALFLVALLRTLWGTGAAWQLPPLAAAARRLESANALSHFPYEALTAKPVLPRSDSAVKTLWQQHQQRARDRLAKLRLPVPHFGLAGADRYHLRLGVAALLVVAVAMGREELGPRLKRAVVLETAAPQSGPAAKITAWATPPSYTGLAPIMLAENGKTAAGTIRIPAGSKLSLRVAATDAAPELVTDQATLPFVQAGAENYAFDAAMPETGLLKITAGWSTLARWPVTVVPDQPPQIGWSKPPELDRQGNVALLYHAADDYGLSKVELTLQLAISARGLPTAPQTFPLSGAGQKQYDGKTALPLAANIWSGMPVTLVVEVTDQAGQAARTPTTTLTLPDYVFKDPLAKEIAALRRNLLSAPEERWKLTVNTLVAMTRETARYRGDPRILLGLRSTAVRMYLDPAHVGLTPAATALWQIALALDNGGLSEARERLRSAQQQLEQALATHADSATVQQKMQELQQAMMDYMQNMARNLPPEQQDIPQDLLDEAGKNMAEEMMRRMQEIQDLAQTGAHDAAQQKLQELQKMLSDLQQMQPMTEEQKADLQNLQQARDLIKQQEQLQEQTGKAEREQAGSFNAPPPQPTYASPRPPDDDSQPQPSGEQPGEQQAQQPQAQQGAQQAQKPQSGPDQGAQSQPGHGDAAPTGAQAGTGQKPGTEQTRSGGAGDKPEPGKPEGSLADRQAELRRQLGKMVDDMAAHQEQPPEQLGKADQGMKSAGEQLRREQYGSAQQEQGKTLQALKDLAGKMKEKIQSQLMALPMGGGTGQGERETKSPFSHSDKENARGAVNGDVKVPDQQEVQRARKILDELRRRSGEYDRPKEERGYIERLLNKF